MTQAFLYDLHTHTSLSDGSLCPTELFSLAKKQGVTHLAITDHDTVAAYQSLNTPTEIQLIPGIELSTLWQGRCIHIVGLNINIKSDAIIEATVHQATARFERAQQIADKLSKVANISNPLEKALALAGKATIGRPHFAEALVEMGVVSSKEKAFRKYLGAGKVGDIKQQWPDIPTTISWIRDAGGTAVIAHPLKYKMTRSKLLNLVDTFTSAGGKAIEVCSGSQQKEATYSLARLCTEKNLLASTGSDFHHPGQSWALPGSQARLPEHCVPVWQDWH